MAMIFGPEHQLPLMTKEKYLEQFDTQEKIEDELLRLELSLSKLRDFVPLLISLKYYNILQNTLEIIPQNIQSIKKQHTSLMTTQTISQLELDLGCIYSPALDKYNHFIGKYDTENFNSLKYYTERNNLPLYSVHVLIYKMYNLRKTIEKELLEILPEDLYTDLEDIKEISRNTPYLNNLTRNIDWLKEQPIFKKINKKMEILLDHEYKFINL